MLQVNVYRSALIPRKLPCPKKILVTYLRTSLFRDIPPSPPLPLRRPNIEKEYNDTFLRPPQTSTVEALKTDLDRPIINLIDKANNVIEMTPKNEKLDLNKYDLHLSKIDKGEVPKQLEFFEGGQNKEFEDKVKLIRLSTDSNKFLEVLQSDFCQEIFIQHKLKIHTETGNIFFDNVETNESIYRFFQQQENQSKAKINFELSFTDSYENYFDWLVKGFKENEDQKFDVLTNKTQNLYFINLMII